MSLFGRITHAISHVAHMVEHEVRAAVNLQAHAFGAALAIASGHPARALQQLKEGAAILATDPLFSVAAGAAKFVPGFGGIVSSGVEALAAIGQGKSLGDAVMAAARAQIPAGPAKAAFDVAIGVAHHQIPPAAMATIRDQLPGGAIAKHAFDVALSVAHGHHPAIPIPHEAQSLFQAAKAAGRRAREPVNMMRGAPAAMVRDVNRILAKRGHVVQH